LVLSRFLKELLKKTLKPIGNFYFVYSAMEEEMGTKQHPILSKIYFQQLNGSGVWNKTSTTEPTGESNCSPQLVKFTCSGSGNIEFSP